MTKPIPNKKPFTLRGRYSYRLRNLSRLLLCSARVSARRAIRGSIQPGWNWGVETGVDFMREQFKYAFNLENIADGREYLDSLIFYSPVLEQVRIEITDDPIQGAWFTPPNLKSDSPILFFPGGGYVFLPLSTASLHALISLATGRRLFALNYPLAPEHPFPAQLQEAQRAFLWLVDELSIESGSMILGGASAGGNLCLSLLLSHRELGRPQPALAFLLSPWVDILNSGLSMKENEPLDWICSETSEKAAVYFLGGQTAQNPLISPLYADLQNLAPIYIQAGGSEVFFDMIQDFASRAEEQSARIQLEVWDKMLHCFQAFGDDIPESRAALDRLAEVVAGTDTWSAFPV